MNVYQLIDQIMLYNSMRTIYWSGSLNLCLTYLKVVHTMNGSKYATKLNRSELRDNDLLAITIVTYRSLSVYM